MTTDLIRRVEGVVAREGEALVESLQALEPEGVAHSEPIGGGMLVLTGPGMFVNRAVGLGMTGPVTATHIDRVEAVCAQVGVPPEFEVCPLADPSLIELLGGRGYRLESFRSVLFHDLELSSGARVNPDVTLTAVTDESLHQWQALAHIGFGIDSGPMRTISNRFSAARYQVDGETLLLAQLGEDTAGCAALSVRDGVAELGGTATDPAFRGLGVQGAAIAHRLALAAEHGCDLAISAADPGSVSERNLKRFGFVLAYTQVFLARPS